MQRLGIREVQCFALDNIPEVGGFVNVDWGDGPHRLLPEPLAGVCSSRPFELAEAIRLPGPGPTEAPGAAGIGTRAGFGVCLDFSFLGRPDRREPLGYFRFPMRLWYRRLSAQISPRMSAQSLREYLWPSFQHRYAIKAASNNFSLLYNVASYFMPPRM